MGGFVNEIEMDSDGVVLIGAVELNNVKSVSLSRTLERETVTRTVFTGVKRVRGPGQVLITCTLNLYDDDGITTSSLEQWRVNHAGSIDKTIKIRPLGSTAGLKEYILDPDSDHYGMDLIDHSWDAESGEDQPLVEGDMTWEGTFDAAPAWTAIPA